MLRRDKRRLSVANRSSSTSPFPCRAQQGRQLKRPHETVFLTATPFSTQADRDDRDKNSSANDQMQVSLDETVVPWTEMEAQFHCPPVPGVRRGRCCEEDHACTRWCLPICKCFCFSKRKAVKIKPNQVRARQGKPTTKTATQQQ